MKKVGEYILVNSEKVSRVLNGMVLNDGSQQGGIAKEDGSFDEKILLAEYDKLGGAILKGKDRVKMGSFYDFKLKKAKAEPEIVLVFKINGKVVELKDGEEESNLIKAAKLLKEDKEIKEVDEDMETVSGEVVEKKSKKKK